MDVDALGAIELGQSLIRLCRVDGLQIISFFHPVLAHLDGDGVA